MNLNEAFKVVIENYEKARSELFSKANPMYQTIIKEIPGKIVDLLGAKWSGLKVKGGVGAGNWAQVPWCCLLDLSVTTTPTKGIYVVYLFNSKYNKIYLSLNQGTDSLNEEYGEKEYINILKLRASLYKSKLNKYKDQLPLDNIVNFRGRKADGYSAGHIIGIEYDAMNLPSDSKLVADLNVILEAYSSLFDNEIEPLDEDDAELIASRYKTIEEKKIYCLHRRIERKSCVKEVKKIHGLKCECCGLNFEERYGKLGKGFIEVHHLIPLSSLKLGECKEYDPHKDFAVLCSNCHRMIHRQSDPSDIDALRKQLKGTF